jgi:hypothetical protein
MDRALRFVGERVVQRLLVRIEDDLRDGAAAPIDRVAGLDLPLERRQRQLGGGRAVAAERLKRKPDERRDDDEGEERAAEESIHKTSFGRVPASV